MITIELYNVGLLLYMVGCTILSYIICTLLRKLKRSIGKLILKLEKGDFIK